MAVRSGRAIRAVDVVERRRGGAACPVIWTVRRPGTPEDSLKAAGPPAAAEPCSRLPYARGRGSRRRSGASSPGSTGRRNRDSYSSARRARAVAALSLIALFRAPTGLAVGLALKESRYPPLASERCDSPLGLIPLGWTAVARLQRRPPDEPDLLVPPRPGFTPILEPEPRQD